MENKMEKYQAECPKCKMSFVGNAKYFRFDLKEKCFDGITKLVNLRIYGTEFDYKAWLRAGEILENIHKEMENK